MPGLWVKAAFYVALVVIGYGWLISSPPTFVETATAYGLFSLSALLLVLNLAHDAAHDALTASRLGNHPWKWRHRWQHLYALPPT